MSALTARDLHKSFGPQVVLNGTTIAIDPGEKVGLIGANGGGKSTLAKIIAGLELPEAGNIMRQRGLTVSYLAQEPVFDPTHTARQIVEAGLAGWRAAVERHEAVSVLLGEDATDALLEEQAALDDEIVRLGGFDIGHQSLDILARLGVRDVDSTVGTKSGGERRRIALAQILVARPGLAILDEPTNHLDADTAEWLEAHLARDFPGAVLLVTHDRYFLESVVTRIVELERGVLVSYPGNYGKYLEKKAELLAQEGRVEQRRQNLLRNEREWLSRGPKARSTKQKARIQRAGELEARGPAGAGRPGEVDLAGALAVASRSGKTILEFRGVSLQAGPRILTEPFDLFLSEGDRLGILGRNGIGKTTMLRAILGESLPASGEVIVGRNTKIGYLDQRRADLDDKNSIFDEVRGEGGTNINLGPKREMDLRSYLELFLFDAGKQRQKIAGLSGGERARVCLAKLLKSGANLLLLDEPTNDLDLATLGGLEELLIDLPAALVVVTHDRAFLDRVATSVLALTDGTKGSIASGNPAKVERHGGGYSDWVAHLAERTEQERRPSQAPESRVDSKSDAKRATPSEAPKPKKKALTYGEQRELETILEKIEEAEKACQAIELQLADPRTYSQDVALVPKLNAALEVARANAAKITARWEDLEARR